MNQRRYFHRKAAIAWRGDILPVLLLCCFAVVFSTEAVKAERTFYVDFDNGTDSNDGRSQNSAWKRAPGDPQATGTPAHLSVKPGDRFVFRGGVVYRGEIRMPASGTREQPIRYLGSNWGDGKAVISGAERYQIEVRPCSVSASCGTMANSGNLRVMELPFSIGDVFRFTLNDRTMHLVQEPRPKDLFWRDHIDGFHTLALGAAVADNGRITVSSDWLTDKTGADLADARLMLWGEPNVVSHARFQADASAPGVFQIESSGFKPYRNAATRIALVNHPRLVREPHDFATIAGGTRLVIAAAEWIGSRAELRVPRRANAFFLNGQSHVVIEGFRITDLHGRKGDHRGGAALLAERSGSSNIVFRMNKVDTITSLEGVGAVQANWIDGLVVAENLFENILFGSGIRAGVSSRIDITSNRFEQIGRTGILVSRTKDVAISRNSLKEIYGNHGNGISIYGENRNVSVKNNTIVKTIRGITFHGDNRSELNILIEANLLKTNGKGDTGIRSWGARTSGLRIESNVALSERGYEAIRIHPSDDNVTIAHNLADSIVVPAPGSRLEIKGNWQLRSYSDHSRLAQTHSGVQSAEPAILGDLQGLFARDGPSAASCSRIAELLGHPPGGIGAAGHCARKP